MNNTPEGLSAKAYCFMEGCIWRGGSKCIRCGKRLRCSGCGRFVREDQLKKHLNKSCPHMEAIRLDEHSNLRSTIGP